jgi:ribonuclease G
VANELVVSATEEDLQIAIIEDKKLVEIHTERRNNRFAVGDVYIGIVKRILPGLNAAFVDIGYPRDAFLHYLDLGPQIESQKRYIKSILASKSNITPIGRINPQPDINKHGKIAEVLKPNQLVLVQIMKEAISSKGPRLSSQISIPGEYLILLPFGEDVSISRKFKSNEEKRRLKQQLEGLKVDNIGIIARTAAEGRDFSRLKEDFDRLMDKWEQIVQEVAQAKAPKKVLSEMDRTTSLLRDMLSLGFDAIYTDDNAIFNEVKDYLEKNQPDLVRNLQLKRPRNGLFDYFGIEKQIKTDFGKNVNLHNGSYIIIEHTEALHVIDVNSGSQRPEGDAPEDHAMKINMEAATEVARQLRLRDIGGIIVVDFIDVRRIENKRRLYDHVKQVMSKDRARHSILPISRFGLMEITRQRVRPEVSINTEEVCPSCSGTGKMQPAILLTDSVMKNVDYLIRKNKAQKIKIVANPFLAAFLTQGLPSIRMKWFFQYKRWIRIVPSTALAFTEVRYYDEYDEEIVLD